jgi:cell division protein FtsB
MSTELQRRIDELSREIRAYPTPIARCDEQLTQLLEERARLQARLQAPGEDLGCGPDARWINDGGFDAA